MEALVLGAGVSGLTTAAILRKSGMKVRILAEKPPAETTSASAGASWSPYMVKHPLAVLWSETSRTKFEALAKTPEVTGVRLLSGIEASKHEVPVPGWASTLPKFRLCKESELPAGYVMGWWSKVPVIDMPKYLDYLVWTLKTADVHISIGKVESLDVAPIVINCTGVAARSLTDDTFVVPTKGQLVVVRNPGIRTYFQDHAEGQELTYFLPHGDRVVLGGCAISDDLEPSVDLKIAEAIIQRCAMIDPRLAKAEVLERKYGFRPNRKLVRVERETTPKGTVVVHNYGHGGAGVTLSWGCAEEVLKLLH